MTSLKRRIAKVEQSRDQGFTMILIDSRLPREEQEQLIAEAQASTPPGRGVIFLDPQMVRG